MTIHEARLIRELKKRCTYRRLAEIYYPKDNPLHGVQAYGEDLCKEALEVLYPGISYWSSSGFDYDEEFYEENRSYIGDFFWWL